MERDRVLCEVMAEARETVNDVNTTLKHNRLKSAEQSRAHGDNAPEVYMSAHESPSFQNMYVITSFTYSSPHPTVRVRPAYWSRLGGGGGGCGGADGGCQ